MSVSTAVAPLSKERQLLLQFTPERYQEVVQWVKDCRTYEEILSVQAKAEGAEQLAKRLKATKEVILNCRRISIHCVRRLGAILLEFDGRVIPIREKGHSGSRGTVASLRTQTARRWGWNKNRVQIACRLAAGSDSDLERAFLESRKKSAGLIALKMPRRFPDRNHGGLRATEHSAVTKLSQSLSTFRLYTERTDANKMGRASFAGSIISARAIRDWLNLYIAAHEGRRDVCG